MIGEGQLFDRKGNRKYLNADERLRFYEAAVQLSDSKYRAFALTLFHTGCRISEALSLTPGGIDAGEKTVVVRTLKQRDKLRFRAIPIPDGLLDLLEEQSASLAQSERLWGFCRTTAWKTVKGCMAEAKLEGIKGTPKGLRHGYAVACVSKGVPLPTLKRWMGHSSMETTGIYLDFVGDDERNLAAKVWEDVEKP